MSHPFYTEILGSKPEVAVALTRPCSIPGSCDDEERAGQYLDDNASLSLVMRQPRCTPKRCDRPVALILS
jgi:hypothetical protein